MRAAIYFTPPAEALLTRAASLWLGRDALSDEATRDPDPVLDPLVADPARYGFHATLRAPFRLAEGCGLGDVDAALARLAASLCPVVLPALALRRVGAAFALVPEAPDAALAALEATVLAAFEPFRSPLDAAEIARRQPHRLSERQRAHLLRWGYPYVLADFRFHMTLTGAVEEERTDAVGALLRERFAGFAGQPLAIDRLALFTEAEPGAAFRVHSLHRLGAS